MNGKYRLPERGMSACQEFESRNHQSNDAIIDFSTKRHSYSFHTFAFRLIVSCAGSNHSPDGSHTTFPNAPSDKYQVARRLFATARGELGVD